MRLPTALCSARRQHRLADDVAPSLDALARSTAAGRSLGQALSEVAHGTGPFAARLRGAAQQHALGVALPDALASLRRDDSGPEESLALSTLEVLARVGGAVPGALDRAAVAVRDRRAITADRQAGAAQARLSASVISALPLVVAVWAGTGDSQLLGFLLHHPSGRLCLAAATLLNVTGWYWMRRIIGRAA